MELRVHLYIRPDHRSIPSIVSGFQRHGITPRVLQRVEPCDLAVIWGYQWIRKVGRCRRTLVFERGYVGNRRRYVSAGYDGLNGFADFRNKDMPGDRWQKFFSSYLKPWREDSTGYVLVAGQVPGDMSLRGLDPHAWCLSVAERVAAAGHDVAIRWHPKSPAKPPKTAFRVLPATSLSEALAGASYLVTYNSNAAVDAVLAGTPTVTLDEGSMAYEVTGHDPIVMPPKPDRTQWVYNLAFAQWQTDTRRGRVNEIATGEAWAHLAGGMQ